MRTPKRTTQPRARNGKAKARADVPPHIDVLLEIAACAGDARPLHALSSALDSLASALRADRCTVASGGREQEHVIAESRSPDHAHASETETRAAIVLGEAPLGELTADSAHALEQPAVALLGRAATLIGPTLLSLRLGDSAPERDHGFTQRVLDSLPLGMHVVDRDYRIRAWNRTRENGLQGVQRNEALGRSIFEVLNRQSESGSPPRVRHGVRDGRDSAVRRGVGRAGPSARVYRISKAPIRNAQGDVTHVITIGEDVTDAVRAREEVAQARKLAAVGTLAAGAMHEINNPLATIGACAETLALQLDQ